MRSGQRLITVATATLVTTAGLSSAAAFADPPTVPPLPDPSSAVSLVQQTVSTAVQQVTGATAPVLSPTPSPAPKGTPITTTHTTQTRVVRKEAAAPAKPRVAPAAATSAAPPASLDSVALQLPAVARLAAFEADAPAIAPPPHLAPAQMAPGHVTQKAASVDNLSNHHGSPLRALLLALAGVAAAALAREHVRQLQRQR